VLVTWHAGRRKKLIENYVVSGTDPDQNRTTEFVYNSDGLVTDLVAWNSTTGNQATKYAYGTAVSFTSPDVHRNDLLRAVIYPDSLDTYSGGTLNDGTDSQYDRVEYKYNRQGEVIELKEQNGTVHERLPVTTSTPDSANSIEL
jgi:hypothetical protein